MTDDFELSCESTRQFGSEVWLLVGWTRSLAAWMAFDDGRIAFADETGQVIFAGAVEDVTDVHCPWYYFRGGLKLRIHGHAYRISFIRPNDQPRRWSAGGNWEADDAFDKFLRACKLGDSLPCRTLTKIWEALLTASPADWENQREHGRSAA